ncbi:hypothetical protein ACFL2V_11295 [Pseudomonadota bacterium]
MADVPHMAMLVSHGENSDYCPFAVYYKNSYMCISGVVGENIYYSFWTNDSKDCTDCYACFRCEKCYECIECINLYNSIFCKDSENGSDLAFCTDCDGCKNCIGCFGLRNKEYYIFNKQVSKEEYEKINKEMRASSNSLLEMREKMKEHVLKYPQRALQMVNTESCTGNYLINSRNSHDCFLAEGLEDCAYMWNIPVGCTDCMDLNYSPSNELAYNSISTINSYQSVVIPFCWDVKTSNYSFQCFYSQDLFGCMGLKHEKFCILNKKYSEKEYKELLPRIIEHMKGTGEWGEFFPIENSPFGYNETIAQDFFSLSKEEIEKRGWKWAELETKKPAGGEATEDVIICEVSGKPFKVIPQEKEFYKKMELPLPSRNPNVRHLERHAQVNERKLYDRKCDKCEKEIQTTFSKKRPETVYCEECYLKEIY